MGRYVIGHTCRTSCSTAEDARHASRSPARSTTTSRSGTTPRRCHDTLQSLRTRTKSSPPDSRSPTPTKSSTRYKASAKPAWLILPATARPPDSSPSRVFCAIHIGAAVAPRMTGRHRQRLTLRRHAYALYPISSDATLTPPAWTWKTPDSTFSPEDSSPATGSFSPDNRIHDFCASPLFRCISSLRYN